MIVTQTTAQTGEFCIGLTKDLEVESSYRHQRIYYVPDIRVIYTSLFIATMTSRKKVPVSSFGYVSSPHGRDASAHKILRQ